MEPPRRSGAPHASWRRAICATRIGSALLIVSAVGASTARAEIAGLPGHEWIEVEPPGHDNPLGSLLEVRGSARAIASRAPIRLVVALDLSRSAVSPAGWDVDGDGWMPPRLTRARAPLVLPGAPAVRDSIAAAGVRAVRDLLRRLDPTRDRVALLTFAGSTRLEHALDRPASLAGPLDRVRIRSRGERTDIAEAIRTATALIDACSTCPDERAGGAPARIVLLVSDGVPTSPVSRRLARRAALREATRAADRGVRVFGLSSRQAEAAAVLREIAAAGDGRAFSRQLPAPWLLRLQGWRPLAVREVTLHNRSTDAPGRAVRWFGDGSFDGFIELSPGPNQIEIQVRLNERGVLRHSMRVDHTPSPEPPAQALARRLRARSVEMELLLQMRDAARPRRTLEIAPAPAPTGDHP